MLVQNEQCLPVIGRKVLQKGPNPDRIRIKNNPDPQGLNINLYFTFDFTLILKLTVIIIIKIVAKVLNNIIFENKATGSQIILELVPVLYVLQYSYIPILTPTVPPATQPSHFPFSERKVGPPTSLTLLDDSTILLYD